MTLHLNSSAAELCISVCESFCHSLNNIRETKSTARLDPTSGGFHSAGEISKVYSLLIDWDLQSLLSSFSDQVEAMGVVFAIAGGLIDAQDQEVAAALGKAEAPEPQLLSLTAMGSLNSLTNMISAPTTEYFPVDPEDVSAASFEQIRSSTEALDPGQFHTVSATISGAASALREASTTLQVDLGAVLGQEWTGQFHETALNAINNFTRSGLELAESLDTAAHKAGTLAEGYGITQGKIFDLAAAQSPTTTSAPAAPGLPVRGSADPAPEMARYTINTIYNPALMDANLSTLDFPTAYKVLSTSLVNGAGGIDLSSAWNTDGRQPIAKPAPSAALAAVTSATAASGYNADASTTVASNGALDTAATSVAHTSLGTPDSGTPGVSASTIPAATPLPTTTPATANGFTRAGGTIRSPHTVPNSDNTGTNRMGNSASNSPLGSSAMAGAGTLAGLSASNGAGASSSGGRALRAIIGSGAGGSSIPMPPRPGIGGSTPTVGTSPSNAIGSTAGPRSTVGPMSTGVMGPASGAHRDSNRGHTPASYLINAINTSELLGPQPKVSPAVIRAPEQR